MADVLAAPAQKLEGATQNPAGPPMVDLARLDSTTKTAQAKPDAAATTDTGTSSPLLSSLSIVDGSKPTQVADASQAQAPAEVNPAPGKSPAQIADARTQAAPADNCDKSDACSFQPTTDREKSKEWWDARAQRLGVQPEKDANCMYTVKFGDDLSTIAQRQLQSEGKAVNAASLKAEQDKIIKLNDAQYKSLDCNPHFLKTGWRLNLDDCCTKPEVAAPAPAPAPAPEVAPPAPAKVEPPCVDAPPPPRVEDCDRTGARPDARNAEHLYVTPQHHIIDRQTGCPYDIPPGSSIIYNNHGKAQMITVENPDGSKPEHSPILFGVDQHGNRVDLTQEQKQAYAEHFDCNLTPAPAVDQGAVLNDRTYADQPAPQWQQDSSGQQFYQSEGRDWYRDDQNRDYFRDQQGRNWYEDQQNRPYYVDQGHCWYEDQQGRDYFQYQGRNYFRSQDPNQVYYEQGGQKHWENNTNIITYNTTQNFYGSQGLARPAAQGHEIVVPHVPHMPHGQNQDRFSTQETGANAVQAQHDAELRRAEHQRLEAERQQKIDRDNTERAQRTAHPANPNPAPVVNPGHTQDTSAPKQHVPTAAEINAMKSEHDRTQARTDAANALQVQRAHDAEVKRQQVEAAQKVQAQHDRDVAAQAQRAADERLAHQRQIDQARVQTRPAQPIPVVARPATPPPQQQQHQQQQQQHSAARPVAAAAGVRDNSEVP